MKKLVFDYEMRLSFSAPVTDHRFQLRCIPSTGPRQQVIDVEVKIQPETELETTIDSFDSVVMTGFIPEPHDIFSYSVTGIAFVDNAHIHKEAYKTAVPIQFSAHHSRPERGGDDCRMPRTLGGAAFRRHSGAAGCRSDG